MKANAQKRKVFQDAVDLISPPEEKINLSVDGQARINFAVESAWKQRVAGQSKK